MLPKPNQVQQAYRSSKIFGYKEKQSVSATVYRINVADETILQSFQVFTVANSKQLKIVFSLQGDFEIIYPDLISL